MKLGKFFIGKKQNDLKKPDTAGVNVKIGAAFERPGYEVETGVSVMGSVGVLFNFNYQNQKQIKAMNQEYGDVTKRGEYSVEHNFNDVNYCAVSKNGTQIDYMGVSIYIDPMLDAVMKRFMEQNQMNVIVDGKIYSGKYDKKVREAVYAEVNKLILYDKILKKMNTHDQDFYLDLGKEN